MAVRFRSFAEAFGENEAREAAPIAAALERRAPSDDEPEPAIDSFADSPHEIGDEPRATEPAVPLPEPPTAAIAYLRFSDLRFDALRGELDTMLDTLAAELGRLRATIAEDLQARATACLSTLAIEVLGRELALAPADIDTFVSEALDRYGRSGGLRLRVASADYERVAKRFDECEPDEELVPGDLIVELGEARFDAKLASRVAAFLDRLALLV